MKKCKECGCKFDPEDAAAEFDAWVATMDFNDGYCYDEEFTNHQFCGECAINIVENWIAVGEEEEEGGDWD